MGKRAVDLFPAPYGEVMLAGHREAVQTGLPQCTLELTPGPDGLDRTFVVRRFPIKGPSGRVFVGGFALDVSVAEDARRELLESEGLFKELADHMPQIVWIQERDRSLSYLNRRYYEYTGLPRTTPGQEGWDLVVHPEDRGAAYAEFERCLDSGEPWDWELRLKNSEGEYRWHLSRAVPVHDENGSVLRWVATSTDIHQQKVAEESLLEAQEFNRRIADTMPAFLYVKDLVEHRNIALNAKMAEILGVAPEVLDAMKSADLRRLMHPDDLHLVQKKNWEPNETSRIEYRMRHADGSYRWVEDRAVIFKSSEDGKPQQMLGIAQDVTDRRSTEDALRRSERRYGQTLEAARVGSWDWHLKEKLLTHHKNLEPLLGLSEAGELSQEDVLSRVHPDDQLKVREALGHTLRTGEPYEVEFRVMWPDGAVRWLASKGGVVKDSRGLPERVTGVNIDITERKNAEQALRLSDQRGHFLLAFNDSIREVGDPSEVLARAIDALAGYLRPNVCSYAQVGPHGQMEVLASFSRSDADSTTTSLNQFGPAVAEQLQSGETVVVPDINSDSRHPETSPFRISGLRSGILVPLRKEGVLIAILAVMNQSARAWSEFTIGLLEEVAERTWMALQNARSESRVRELNAELENRVEQRTAELLDTVRELEGFAYTVSHDLRAPLRAINATSRMLQLDHSDGLNGEAQDLLSRQAEAAKKMGLLIDQLLRYSRIAREEIVLERVDLSSVARDVMEELKHDAANAKIRFDIADDMRTVGDSKLLKLVLGNLMENACKFSPGGGAVRVTPLENDENSTFYVEDEGIGFDMAYAETMWRPFSRLVRDDEFPGTGIGLANVQRIMHRHGGKVWAESKPGKGSRFYFSIPQPPAK